MRISCTHHAKLVGIHTDRIGHLQSAHQRGPRIITFIWLRCFGYRGIKQVLIGFKIRKRIVWREFCVGFTVALVLRYLVDRLPALAQLGILKVNGISIFIKKRKHGALGQVHVVGNGNKIRIGGFSC